MSRSRIALWVVVGVVAIVLGVQQLNVDPAPPEVLTDAIVADVLAAPARGKEDQGIEVYSLRPANGAKIESGVQREVFYDKIAEWMEANRYEKVVNQGDYISYKQLQEKGHLLVVVRKKPVVNAAR